MRKYLILILAVVVSFQLNGKQVDLQRAQNVAALYLSSLDETELKSISVSELIPVSLNIPGGARFQKQKSTRVNKDQLVYFFKVSNGGFVLVSGDDLARPILGYSTDSPVDENNLPVNFLKWVEGYREEISFLRKQPEMKSLAANSDWVRIEKGERLSKTSASAAGPLMTTKWDQSPYYNYLCPQKNAYSNKAVTGCVATAMAQVIKYHNYPVNGTGIHSYYHSNNTVTYGTLSANYGATTYDWANMPNQLNNSSTAAQVKAVATLMLHCGIGADMDYSPNSSGAQILESRSQGSSCAEYAIKEFFNYDKTTVKGVMREGMTTQQWIALLKAEIDAKRPILHGGVGDGGGHAFVADGYDSNNYFHFNWGWSGNSDGYYSVDALNPVDLGTGAGNGSYNSIQQVVVGIQPPSAQGTSTGTTKSEDIRLFSNINLPKIYQLNEFEFEVSIGNYGTTDFRGNFCAALFDNEGRFVTFIDSLDNQQTLSAGYYNTYSFSNKGLSVYPGKFFVGIYFRPVDNNWVAVGDNNDYKNFVDLEIFSPFGDTEIGLYDSIRVSTNPIITGSPLTITANVANYGNYTYNGQFGAGLFTLDGDIVQTLEIIDVKDLPAMYFDSFTFKTDKITAEPGTYYIGLVHFPNSGDDQIVIAPNNYLNPLEVNVTIPALVPDRFENNDQPSEATSLTLQFEDNIHWYYYTDINLDNQNDEDYFKFDLPEGYQYKIWARIHDSYKNEIEDESYTCDVIFAHSDKGEWSEIFDTEMDYTYTMDDGGEIYFGVIPYYEGETGSYSIEFKIERTKGSDDADFTSPSPTKIYPNPASRQVNIISQNPIQKIELIDQTGRIVSRQQTDFDAQKAILDLEGIVSGVYNLKIYYSKSVQIQKLLVHE